MNFDKDLSARQEARNLAKQAAEAQHILADLPQEKLDAIVESIAKAFSGAAEKLAQLAVEETGLAPERIGYKKPDKSASAPDVKYGDRPFFRQFGFRNLLRDDLGEGKSALIRTPVAEATRQGHELELFAPWHGSLELRRK